MTKTNKTNKKDQAFTALPLSAIEAECKLVEAQVERAMTRVNRLLRSVAYHWFKGSIDGFEAAGYVNNISNVSPYHKAAVVAMGQAALGLQFSNETKELFGHVDQKLSEKAFKAVLEKDFRDYKKPQEPEAWNLISHFTKLMETAQTKKNTKPKANSTKPAPVIPSDVLSILTKAQAEIEALSVKLDEAG